MSASDQLDLFFDTAPAEAGALPSCAPPLGQIVSERPRVAGEAKPTSRRLESLADVLAVLVHDRPKTNHYAQLKSAVRMMGEVLHLPLVNVPVAPFALRRLIVAANCASAGMKPKRWTQVRSLVRIALTDVGLDVAPGRDNRGLTPDWQEIACQLPTRSLRTGLSRFMSYCSRQAVVPNEVTVEVFEQFQEHLANLSLKDSPDRLYRLMAANWNKALELVASWPQVPAPLAASTRRYALPWDAFPSSFSADVETYLNRCGNEDIFADDYGPGLRQSTVKSRRQDIQRIASLLVASGKPADEVTDLAALVRVESARAALKGKFEQDGSVRTPSLGQHAWLLSAIARQWVQAPASQLKALSVLANNMTQKQRGMTERNRERLRQFDLPENVATLLYLPAKVMKNVKRKKRPSYMDARRVMLAVAVEVLTQSALRAGNLAALDIDRHFRRQGRGRKAVQTLYIPGSETKTGEAFEMRVPEETARLIEQYITHYRPLIFAGSSTLLFPGKDGGRRNEHLLSQQISKFIERETGIRMNAHLFRHFAGKLHLERRPGDMETVRRILGHRSIQTTTTFYAELPVAKAFQRYDETLSILRAAGGGLSRRRASRPVAEAS